MVADAWSVTTAALDLCCRRNSGDVVPRAKGGIASRTMLVGVEAMTAELELVVDPAMGGEGLVRITGWLGSGAASTVTE